MKRPSSPHKTIWLLAGIALASVAGCPWLTAPENADLTAKLTPFSTSDELLGYFKQQARERNSLDRSYGMWGLGGMAFPTAANLEADDATGDADASDGEQTYTTTNVQEAGVDESDVIKSDGQYFYIARGDNLRIVKAKPVAQMAEIASLDLEVYVRDMHLYGTKLILLAQRYAITDDVWARPEIEIWPPYYASSQLTLVTIDVSDPAVPAVLKQVDFDGSLVESRLINDRLILVLTIAPNLPNNPTVSSVNAMPLDDFLPKVQAGGVERDMVGWDDCLHPDNPDGYYMTAVVTVDAADIESILHSVAVVAGAGTIYASPEALYLTDTSYYSSGQSRVTTDIHKFAFDDGGAARYVASGVVPGRLLNQFSLGEYQDILRVASHVENQTFFGVFDDVSVSVAEAGASNAGSAQAIQPPSDFNAVYLLEQKGSALEVKASLENIAPGEDLYAARFIGERGFLVTFERIDPLFTLDLSDPAKPAVKGELKVPGYSEYLHPWGDDFLIGVGRSTVENEWGATIVSAVQLSLFDVSDLANPVEIDRMVLGGYGSWCEVSSTHKAFAMLADDGLLAFPAYLTPDDAPTFVWTEPEFDGVVCLRVDQENGFEEVGRVEAVAQETDGYYYYYASWRRPAFIDGVLYAISDDGVAAGAVADLSADPVTVQFEE